MNFEDATLHHGLNEMPNGMQWCNGYPSSYPLVPASVAHGAGATRDRKSSVPWTLFFVEHGIAQTLKGFFPAIHGTTWTTYTSWDFSFGCGPWVPIPTGEAQIQLSASVGFQPA